MAEATAQTGPGETKPDIPASTTSLIPVNLTLRELPDAFELTYNNASRKSVFTTLFTKAGVSIDWRDRSAADEIISGHHQGSLDTIAGELLAGRNFLATYEPVNSAPRMAHLVVLGTSGAGASPAVSLGAAAPAPALGPAGTPAPAEPGSCIAAATAENDEPFISAAVSGHPGEVSLRDRGQVLLDDSRILLAGGIDACTGRASDAAEILDQATGATTPTGRMKTPRAGFALHKLASGDVLAFGGSTGGGVDGTTDKVERYEVATGQWRAAGLLALRKSGIAACGLGDGSVLLVGGGDGNAEAARSAEIYEPAAGTTRPAAGRASYTHVDGTRTLSLRDGRCLVASNGPGANLELFDPATGAFRPVAVPSEMSIDLLGATLLGLLPDGSVLIVSNRSFVLDPASGRFRTIP
jgi:hypothetical protein